MKSLKKSIKYGIIALLLFMVFNAIKIYQYSFEYSEKRSDVAIILGAGTNGGILSPVFKERINHSINLYKKKCIKKVIFTGGKGEGQVAADSEIARNYAIKKGVKPEDILMEANSHYTYENLTEAKLIMNDFDFATALIVSDPIHMKRAMELARNTGMECVPSPTKTSMYRTTIPKLEFLAYETVFYTLGKLTFKH